MDDSVCQRLFVILTIQFADMYRVALKGGPVLLSNRQAEISRNLQGYSGFVAKRRYPVYLV